ncbi:E3 SUMO-protein ligase ZBED1-like [Puntigrus tetrazona]|uniref:E3 SUMO-protein ligase ZBED1-like n=1 Tax=Puntigrus tetrazona TaxID=1606681 RepID=UPI001C88FF0E|nr:E3 SUMO-protein ligase ZBED1-like [Puntigrus tetrazona]
MRTRTKMDAEKIDTELVAKKHSTSVVWRYFGFKVTDTEQREVLCNICKIKVATSRGNTTNLYQHLKQHREKYDECMTEKTQISKEAVTRTNQKVFTDMFASLKPYDRSSPRYKEITDSITHFLAKDMMPIHSVSKVGFQNMIRTLDKRYQLPSRHYFSHVAIPTLYNSRRGEVQKEMAKATFFSTTTELWSSRTSEPYVNVTVHFVDEEFELKSRCLQTSYFPDDRTGENIALGLREVLAAWDLCEARQVAITTGNDTNLVKAVELNQWTRIQCFGHRLHLAIENTLKDHAQCINRATGMCRKIVGHFSHSWKKRVALREAQRELNLPEHAMVTDCSTRWGSTQKMIARVLEQQNALSKVLSTDRKVQHLLLSWQDLEVLESVNKALSPLKDFTDALSGESYVSISCVKPALHILNSSVLVKEEVDTDLTKSLKSNILSYLNNKYEDTQDLLNLTTFLDPRFRSQYIPAEVTETLKERVISELMEIHQKQTQVVPSTAVMENDSLDVESPPAAKAKKKTLASFFQENTYTAPRASLSRTFDPMAQFREAVAAELNAYIYMPHVDHGEDPLKWWRFHKVNFPRLCKLAQKYLGIQAISSASERAFSSSGNVVSNHRSCLKPDKVDMLVFLSKNL